MPCYSWPIVNIVKNVWGINTLFYILVELVWGIKQS